MTTGVNPFRADRPRVTAFDDSDRRAAGFDAWSVWINAAHLAQLPDKDFGAEATGYMRKTVEALTAKLAKIIRDGPCVRPRPGRMK